MKIKSNISDFFTNFKNVLKRPEMAILPGQLAYFFFLAIVPTLTLITYCATIGIACSGGQHRSTFVANYLKDHFKDRYNVETYHRDSPELNK